ncbi:DUF488 family protein [Brevibacillus ginsengisoli]
MSNIKVKRIYEELEQTDGMRILVDRLWPRGVTKEEASSSYKARVFPVF